MHSVLFIYYYYLLVIEGIFHLKRNLMPSQRYMNTNNYGTQNGEDQKITHLS